MLGALQAGLCGRAAAAAFVPTDIAGLKLWLKGDAGITQSGGTVSAWNDQSGNGNHYLQTTAGNRPSYTASAIGGKPGITGAVGKYLICATEAVGVSAARTVFIVAKPDVDLQALYAPRISQGYVLYFQHSQAGGQVESNATAVNTTTNNALDNIDSIYEAVFDGITTNKMTLAINGVDKALSNAVGSGVGTENATPTCRISDSYGAPVCEVIVYDTALSAPNKLLVRTYLSGKYSIAI